MLQFVQNFEKATLGGKAHEQLLSLKRIRLHHKVLSKISFNAFKYIIDCSEITKVRQGETLFKQGKEIKSVHFVLYGAFLVTIQDPSRKRVGDIVRGGNVLGEEAFFSANPVYKETATCKVEEAGLLRVDAVMLSELGATNFAGKGQNMMSLQKDFKALFQLLKSIHLTKEQWRGRALGLIAQQAVENDTSFTEFKQENKRKAGGAGGKKLRD